MAAIVAIFNNNGLTELSFGDYDELNAPAYIIWFDDDGIPYDDPVVKVMVEDDHISVEVEARNFSNNAVIQGHEIDSRRNCGESQQTHPPAHRPPRKGRPETQAATYRKIYH